MTSTLMNGTKASSSSLPESMQRMITPQYEQIVNEIENIYHHPDTGCLSFLLFNIQIVIIYSFRTRYNCSMAWSVYHGTKQEDKYITYR
jgi:hypothetical protein